MVAFPRRFKHLLEIEKGDIAVPSHVWVTYCVCAINKDSCGWSGWTLEAVFSDPNAKTEEKLLDSQTDQKCPLCGGETFRTEASYRFDISQSQAVSNDFKYDVIPMEYNDE